MSRRQLIAVLLLAWAVGLVLGVTLKNPSMFERSQVQGGVSVGANNAGNGGDLSHISRERKFNTHNLERLERYAWDLYREEVNAVLQTARGRARRAEHLPGEAQMRHQETGEIFSLTPYEQERIRRADERLSGALLILIGLGQGGCTNSEDFTSLRDANCITSSALGSRLISTTFSSL